MVIKDLQGLGISTKVFTSKFEVLNIGCVSNVYVHYNVGIWLNQPIKTSYILGTNRQSSVSQELDRSSFWNSPEVDGVSDPENGCRSGTTLLDPNSTSAVLSSNLFPEKMKNI